MFHDGSVCTQWYKSVDRSALLVYRSLAPPSTNRAAVDSWRSPCSSAAVVHAAAARPAVPSVNNRPSLVSGRSLHFLEHSARWCAVRTVCLFLPATAKDIPVSPVISGHHSLNFRTTPSWTLQKFRLFSWLALTLTLARLVIQEARTASDVVIVSAALYSAISRLCTTFLCSICAAVRSSEMAWFTMKNLSGWLFTAIRLSISANGPVCVCWWRSAICRWWR